MSDFALFLTSAGLALVSAAAAIAAAIMAFRWRKAAPANGAPPVRNGHKHRPWFRFLLTLVVMAVAILLIQNLSGDHDKISNMVAMLIGILVNKVADAIGQAFNWWFGSENDEKPDTAQQPADDLPKKALPDDY